MGDRANIYIKDEGNRGVFLYTHWSGYRYGLDLQKALRRKQRWDDDSYLARIIFDQMTDGHHGEETGFGISAGVTFSGKPVLVVDPLQQKVWLGSEAVPPEPDGPSWSFQEFCDLDIGEDWPS